MDLKEWNELGKPINEVICGDCLECLKLLPNNFVDLVVTSPPTTELELIKTIPIKMILMGTHLILKILLKSYSE